MEPLPAEPAETLHLLDRVRAGDRQAFDDLFARHRPYLHQVVGLRLDPKLQARVDASDVVQEAQLEAVRRLSDYLENPAMPFRLWLRQIAQDRLLKLRRQHLGAQRRTVGREQPLPATSSLLLAQQFLAADSTPSRQVSQRELVERVEQAVGQLSETDREILLLRNHEGLSYHEVSYVVGIDAASARKRYGRALLRLRKLLRDSGLLESQP